MCATETSGPLFIDSHVHFHLEHLEDFTAEFPSLGLSSAWNIVNDPSVHEGATWQEFHTLVEKSLARAEPIQTFYWPNYTQLTDSSFVNSCVKRVRELAKRGILGLKVWKDMGLGVKDPQGKLMMLDDERLNPVWETLIKLRLILIAHVADPANYWLPFDETNPSYESLKRHPEWWFGKSGLPSREQLFEARNRLHHRYPELTILNCHFGGYAPDFTTLGKWMDEMPNFYVSLGAYHIKDQSDKTVAAFMEKHSNRITFETDLGIRRGRKSDAPWNKDYYDQALAALKKKFSPYGADAIEKFSRENALRLIRDTGRKGKV